MSSQDTYDSEVYRDGSIVNRWLNRFPFPICDDTLKARTFWLSKINQCFEDYCRSPGQQQRQLGAHALSNAEYDDKTQQVPSLIDIAARIFYENASDTMYLKINISRLSLKQVTYEPTKFKPPPLIIDDDMLDDDEDDDHSTLAAVRSPGTTWESYRRFLLRNSPSSMDDKEEDQDDEFVRAGLIRANKDNKTCDVLDQFLKYLGSEEDLDTLVIERWNGPSVDDNQIEWTWRDKLGQNIHSSDGNRSCVVEMNLYLRNADKAQIQERRFVRQLDRIEAMQRTKGNRQFPVTYFLVPKPLPPVDEYDLNESACGNIPDRSDDMSSRTDVLWISQQYHAISKGMIHELDKELFETSSSSDDFVKYLHDYVTKKCCCEKDPRRKFLSCLALTNYITEKRYVLFEAYGPNEVQAVEDLCNTVGTIWREELLVSKDKDIGLQGLQQMLQSDDDDDELSIVIDLTTVQQQRRPRHSCRLDHQRFTNRLDDDVMFTKIQQQTCNSTGKNQQRTILYNFLNDCTDRLKECTIQCDWIPPPVKKRQQTSTGSGTIEKRHRYGNDNGNDAAILL